MTIYILDTDHLSVLQRREEPAYSILDSKLSNCSPDLIFITIVSFQEQFQGWMAYLKKVKTPAQLITAYSKFEQLIKTFSRSQILSFDEKALRIEQQLRRGKIRMGTLDLRIASITLSQNALLLTRNTRDFKKVPNLKIDDWTI